MLDRGHTVALDDFSLILPESPPAITAVVGESGSGKTTLARLLLGIAEPTRGEILYRGKDLRKLSAPLVLGLASSGSSSSRNTWSQGRFSPTARVR